MINWEKYVTRLDNGQILLDYGPVTMTILVEQEEELSYQTLGYYIFNTVNDILNELTSEINYLRNEVDTDCHLTGSVGTRMIEAVHQTGDTLLTPMAAVAGSVADATADALLRLNPNIKKISVNNGGDIAIRLKSGKKIRLLLPTGTRAWIELSEEMGIGGVATSGLGGRSLTMGVAESVTVFASKACVADAYATHFANSTHITSVNVKEVYAEELDINTDIPGLRVVTEVKNLLKEEIEQAEQQLRYEVYSAIEQEKVYAVVAVIGGQAFFYGMNERRI